MADSSASTPFETPSSSSKDKAAIPTPRWPKCQASIVFNCMCETAANAVTHERRRLGEKLKNKQSVIIELTTRLKRWNDMRCCYCEMALKDQGPRVLAMYEMAYLESPDYFAKLCALGEELPDNTEVLARLARIGEYLARLRGDTQTEVGPSTSIPPTSL